MESAVIRDIEREENSTRSRSRGEMVLICAIDHVRFCRRQYVNATSSQSEDERSPHSIFIEV
jgi:hypothetical protein